MALGAGGILAIILVVILVIIIAWLIIAVIKGWWPFNKSKIVALDVPGGITIPKSTTNGSISVTCNTVTNATGYILYSGTTSTTSTFAVLGFLTQPTSGSTVTFTPTGLTHGAYYFSVQAIGIDGASDLSVPMAGTVPGSTSMANGGYTFPFSQRNQVRT